MGKLMTTRFDVTLWDCGCLTWVENNEFTYLSCGQENCRVLNVIREEMMTQEKPLVFLVMKRKIIKDTSKLLAAVREIVKEHWEKSPKGFILTTRKQTKRAAAMAGVEIQSYGGYRGQGSTYADVAHEFKRLGGVFHDHRSKHGAVEVKTTFSAASTWEFKKASK